LRRSANAWRQKTPYRANIRGAKLRSWGHVWPARQDLRRRALAGAELPRKEKIIAFAAGNG